MKYFVQTAHTKKEWVYKRHHNVLFGAILAVVLIGSCFIFALAASFCSPITNLSTTMFLAISIALALLSLAVTVAVAERLGKAWEIYWRIALAIIEKRKITATFIGTDLQIIQISKK
jgi:hypothetical protein